MSLLDENQNYWSEKLCGTSGRKLAGGRKKGRFGGFVDVGQFVSSG